MRRVRYHRYGGPDVLRLEEGQPEAGMTAYQAVGDASRLHPGQAVFINGCLGGVGRDTGRRSPYA